MRKGNMVAGDSNILDGILREYDEKYRTIKSFTSDLEKLISKLLNSRDLKVHSVTSRVKARDSLIAKCGRIHEEKYKKLNDITDISGIRVITFFPDEVDAVAELIQKEFTINYRLSDDKRAELDPDKFGYLSLHYIAKLSRGRLRLAEYRRYRGLQAEIQIRTILQHTWAEIEHDLGYKTKLSIPRDVRRRFSQLAGVLELVDNTFAQIRDDLSRYEDNVSNQVKEVPELVQIDKASLLAFIGDSELVRQIDTDISTKTNIELSSSISEDIVTERITALNYLNIDTIADLNANMEKKKDLIVKYAVTYLTSRIAASYREKPSGTLTRAISLLYFVYLLLVEKAPSLESLINAIEESGMKVGDPDDLARLLLSAYKSL
ncbi:hypothetical protein ES703_119807 [subsurface metagenome]